ncbi:hypothetical protein P2318_12090 [Myxococcaceae bacterium GXIMD 01537]
MRGMRVAALAVLLAMPALAATPRNAITDLTADVLAPGESEVGVFWVRYARGLLPGLQVSTHAMPTLMTLVNASAKVRLLQRPELRVSLEGSAWWFALGRAADIDVASFPLVLRGTVPLSDNLEVTVAGGYSWFILNSEDTDLSYRRLRGEATLVRYDARGAFLLTAELPLLNTTRAHLDSLLGKSDIVGSLTLDDVPAWSVFLARDQLIGKTGHIRFGLGYRNRPGILFIESIGNVMFRFDVYWR